MLINASFDKIHATHAWSFPQKQMNTKMDKLTNKSLYTEGWTNWSKSNVGLGRPEKRDRN